MDNETLAIAAKSGDRDAAARLYRNNRGLIWRLCRKYPNRRYPMEDFMQEAYSPLIRAVKAYDPDSGYQFTTYLVRAVKWYFARYLEQDRNQRDLLVLDSPADPGDPDGATRGELVADEAAEFEDDTLRRAAMGELFGVIRSCLEKPYYDVLYQRYAEGLSQGEIAGKLGCSAQYVHQMINKAFRTLRHPRNKALYSYRDEFIDGSVHHGSLSEFRHTFTSSVEWAAVRRDTAPLVANGNESAGDREGDCNFPLQG